MTLRFDARAVTRSCQLLVAGLHNSDDDPTLVFEGLDYGEVMRLALRDLDVRAAVSRLPADFNGWAR